MSTSEKLKWLKLALDFFKAHGACTIRVTDPKDRRISAEDQERYSRLVERYCRAHGLRVFSDDEIPRMISWGTLAGDLDADKAEKDCATAQMNDALWPISQNGVVTRKLVEKAIRDLKRAARG